MTDRRPLFKRFPGLRTKIPFRPLASLPTPVEHCPDIGLWVKRDDRTHRGGGGAKIRKLEFLLPTLRAGSCACGPRGSNWLLTLQECAEEVKIFTFPQHYNSFAAGNARRLRPTRRFADTFHFALGMLAEAPRILAQPGRLLPMGGSNPVSTLGYVNAGLELGEQVRRGECPEPDAVFIALGTCGTAAGLSLGLALAGLRPRLFAVRITIPLIARLSRMKRLADRCAGILGLSPAPSVDVQIVRKFWGGYAKPTPAGRKAQKVFAGQGIVLDTSYTAKVAAAALELAPGFQTPLFWHTYAPPHYHKDPSPCETFG